MRDGTDTKRRIEEAAIELFVAQGVAETSIKDIARQAGVSQGAMYNHYASKEALAWSLFADNFAAIGVELRRRAQENDTLEGRLRAMIGYAYRLFDTNWAMATYVFIARHDHMKKVTPDMGNPYSVFRRTIANAIRSGEIPRQDPDVATSLVLGAVIQVTDTKIFGRIKGNLADLSDGVAAACVRLLKG